MIQVRTVDKKFKAEEEPIFLIFEDDADRIRVANQILNMPMKEGKRIWCEYPDNTDRELIMRIGTEEIINADLKILNLVGYSFKDIQYPPFIVFNGIDINTLVKSTYWCYVQQIN